MTRIAKRYGAPFLLSFMPLACAEAQTTFEPKLQLSRLHDDNIRLADQPAGGTWETTTSLGASVRYATELSHLNSDFNWQNVQYQGADHLSDRNDLALVLQGFKQDERNRWQFDAKGFQDSTTTDLLDLDPDDIVGGPGTVQEDVKRQRFFLSPSWGHDLSEKRRIALRYEYADLRYDNTGSTELVDSSAHDLAMTLFVTMDEQNTVFTRLAGSTFSAENDAQYDAAKVSVGDAYRFNERSSSEIAFGVYYLDAQTPAARGNDIDFFYEISSQYTLETTQLLFSAERILVPDDTGNILARDQVRVSLSGLFSPSWHPSFHPLWHYKIEGIHYRNRAAINEILDSKRQYTSIRTTLGWQISDAFDVNVGYRYRRNKEVATADSNALFLTVSYREQFRKSK